jgi:exosortase/archaeosortase family protein
MASPKKRNLKAKQQKEGFRYRKEAIVLLRGLALATPLIVLSHAGFEFKPLQELLFLQITFLLNLIGLKFQTFGYMIITQNLSSIISFDCTAWRQLYIYFALVMLPIGIEWRQRLKGLLLLIPLYFYNTLRAVASIWAGSISYELFKPVHYFLWEFVFLSLIFLFWYHWYNHARVCESDR